MEPTARGLFLKPQPLEHYKIVKVSTSKPRLTQTSLKAGAEPPLAAPIRRTISEIHKTAERQRKIREAENQIEKKAGILDQTEKSKITMTKTMISPSARDAPRFSSRRPQELRRFLRWMEDLYKEAQITDDEEKKDLLGKYADQESEEEWKGLENFPTGNSWEDYKKELIENYPEAAEAERGTPARIRQICRDTKDIRMGDLTTLYSFRRQFMAEAKKLSKDPPAMANRELVELFFSSLNPTFTAAVLQFLGTKAEQKLQTSAQKTGSGRRPEDRYDLEEVCKAAIQVSENSQGMYSFMNIPESEQADIKRSSKVNQYQLQPVEETNKLVQKLESLENVQAIDKDKIDGVSKTLDSRFSVLEGMIKNLASQGQNGNRKEQVPQYDPNSGIRLGQAGTIPKWGTNGKGNRQEGDKCFYCGGRFHYIPECDEFKGDLKAGRVKLNEEGKIRMPDGAFVPNFPNGATIKERIERYQMRKQNQFYCGYDENDEIPEVKMPRYPSQFLNTTEDTTQRLAKITLQSEGKEKELEWRKERETQARNAQLMDELMEQGEKSRKDFC